MSDSDGGYVPTYVLEYAGTRARTRSAGSRVGVLIYNAYSALYSDSHNYRALRISPSHSPSLPLCHSLSLFLFRSRPVLSLISSPLFSVSDYQYLTTGIYHAIFSLFLFRRFENDENDVNDENDARRPWMLGS